MGKLKSANVKECFFLLREFIEDAQALTNQKGIAVLALNHLQDIMAGVDSPGSSLLSCVDTPRLYGVSVTGNG